MNWRRQVQDWGCFVKTAHFEQRQAQRKITDQIVALTVSRGRRFHEGDDTVYFLRRRDLPSTLSHEASRRADGTIVVVGTGGALLTTYRNPLYLRALKHRHH